jgi:NTP pyrophosphatase (non-canonical NTP hydrolase)
MTLKELQAEVGAWHEKTFGNPEGIRAMVASKMIEESIEFGFDPSAEELADMCIVALAYASRSGIDLEAEILRKHEVNLKRVWKFNGVQFTRDKP